MTTNKALSKYVNSKVSLLDLIKKYDLRHKFESTGRYKMSCPFHSENTPSLMIFEDSNTYFCFGCGAGYTVIDFIMNYENISLAEVMKRYSEKAEESSREFVMDELYKKLNQKDGVDLPSYSFENFYRLGIILRKHLKTHPNKEKLVDDIFKEVYYFFKNTEELDEERIDYFTDNILEKIHNEN